MIDYTIVQLTKDVERHGAVPPNQELYDDADFASTMDDCQKMRIIPAILNTREEFFVKTRDYQLSELTDIGGNRLQLTLPSRVIAGRLRGVELIDANDLTRVSTLDRLPPELAGTSNWNYTSSYGYIFQGNTIIIPQNLMDASHLLRLKYFRRPNRLVDMTKAGKVTVVDTITGTITLDGLPTGMLAGTKIDVIANYEPFDAVIESYPIISVGGSTIQVSLANAALITVGDYVCFEFETVIPQLPVECFPILTQFTVSAVLKSLGDFAGAAAVMTELADLEQAIYAMMEGRDEGSPQKVVATSSLWSPARRRGWW